MQRSVRRTGEDASPLWLCFLTPSADCNIPVAISADIRHRGYFLCARSGHAHSHPHSKQKRSIKAEFVFLLPSESSVVSPPLYSWGAPTTTAPTFCHVGNKSASFIPIFSRLSAASLFGYLVWPLPRNGGRVDRIGYGTEKRNTEKNTFPKSQLTPEVDSNSRSDWIKHRCG